jgi:hypothetical protein
VERGYPDENGSTLDLYLWQDRQGLDQRLQEVGEAAVWFSPEGPYQAGQSEQERERQALPLDFGSRLSLLGYSYASAAVAGGDTWSVTTYWRVVESDPGTAHAPLAIFVHALDDGNAVALGWDGLHVSVETWEPGDVLVQIHTLFVPSQTPAGDYRVELGVYSPVSLERLAVHAGPSGAAAPHSRVLLRPLEIH